MLGFSRSGEQAVMETVNPWAFRPGDFVTHDHEMFEITRVSRRHWFTLGRQVTRYVVYGKRLSEDAPVISARPRRMEPTASGS